MKPNNHIEIPKKKLGVLMVNLGTPEKTDYINMWKYLREFLSDKRIIELTKNILVPNTLLYYPTCKTKKVRKVIRYYLG